MRAVIAMDWQHFAMFGDEKNILAVPTQMR